MKNLSITLGVLAILVAVVFGFRYVLPKGEAPLIGKTDDISTAITATSSQAESIPERAKSADELLRSAAMKILDRPVSVKADLSEQMKQLATRKIKEATDTLRQNYDYANPWYDLAAYRKIIGDYIGADDAWSFVSSIRPDDFIALHNLGNLYYDLKNYPEAEQYFLASIGKNPANIDAYIQVAAIYEYNDLAKSSLIEPLLLRGIAANPKEPILLITLGKYYQNKGNLEAARSYFEQALKLNPKNTELEKELQLLGK